MTEGLKDVNELEMLKRYVKDYGDIDIGLNLALTYKIGDEWLYLDERNTFDEKANAYNVYPIFYTKLNKTYKYICPFCHQIHSVYADDFKINTRHRLGCCQNYKKSNVIYIFFGENDVRKGKGRSFIVKYNLRNEVIKND